jgi:hypothetical protein
VRLAPPERDRLPKIASVSAGSAGRIMVS